MTEREAEIRARHARVEAEFAKADPPRRRHRYHKDRAYLLAELELVRLTQRTAGTIEVCPICGIHITDEMRTSPGCIYEVQDCQIKAARGA